MHILNWLREGFGMVVKIGRHCMDGYVDGLARICFYFYTRQ